MHTIVLVDDHPIVLQGVRSLLQNEPDLNVIGEAEDGLEGARLIERLKPDVAILDMMIPGLNGLDLLEQVTQRVPKTRVLMLSMQSDEAYVLEALRKGALGYFLKRCLESDLAYAVRKVSLGRRYLSPPLTERAIEAYTRKAEETPLEPYETLSGREKEVLHLAAEGNTTAQIGARLFISSRTAEHHRERLMRKLGLRTQTDLIRYAIRRGILALNE